MVRGWVVLVVFALCFCLCALRRACTFPRGAGVFVFFCFGGCCVAGWVVSLGVFCWWCVSLCVPCWLPPLFFAVSPLVLHFSSACHRHFCWRHAASHDQQSQVMSAAADSRSALQSCKNADNFAHHSSPAANAPSSSQYRRQSA